MKSLFSKYVWLQLILSILLLFGGVLIIAFAVSGKEGILRDGLDIIAAVILFLFGLFAILTALTKSFLGLNTTILSHLRKSIRSCWNTP